MRLVLLFTFLFLLVNIANAQDIAYVVKNTQNLDFINVLNSLSLTYDIIPSSQVSSTDFSSYRMILIGDEFFPNAMQFPVNNHNSLIVNTLHISDWGLSRTNPSQSIASRPLSVKNIDINKWVTNGLPEITQTYTQAKELYSLTRSDVSGISRYVITAENNDNPDHVITTVFPGKRLFNNKITQGRITFFGITESEFWTSDARELFKRTLLFTLNGNDADSDNFADVLVGGLDCNDNDNTINPDALEIPYDNIDQNCDGHDLTDVDNDGFTSIEASGLDCDDNNPNINPGKQEILDSIDQNCQNDAPVLILDIPDIEINEDSVNNNIIDLNNYFKDTDGDELTFEVSQALNSNIEITNNLVSITPSSDFNGFENIVFTAIDNAIAVNSNQVKLTITNVNDQPFLIKEIEDFSFDEDTSLTIDLLNYFDDIDSTLTYILNGNENVDFVFDNSLITFTPNEDFFSQETITITALDEEFQITSEFTLEILNVNDIPKLKLEIPVLTWDEDFSLAVNLNDYFEDPDNDVLTFSFKNNQYITAEINENILELISPENWYGTDTITITAHDSELDMDSNIVTINIVSLNDSPIITSLEILQESQPAQELRENTPYLFRAEAIDIDSLDLSYEWYLNNNLINNEQEFTYTFDFNSQRINVLKLVVKDELSETSREKNFEILNINRIPFFSTQSEVALNEDEQILVEILASDPDNEQLTFTVISSENIQCTIAENNLEITPKQDFTGTEKCTLQASDSIDTVDLEIVINVLEINDFPLIINAFPESSQRILQNTEISFNIEVEDIDNLDLAYEWYINNNLDSTEKDLSFTFTNPGINKVKVLVLDNNDITEHEWTINVIEIVNSNTFDGETTDFFNVDFNSINNLVLEKTQFGKILFLDQVSLSNKDISNNVVINNNVVSINTQNIPELNKKAVITMLHQSYSKAPVIFKTSAFTQDPSLINELCLDCKIISFTQGPATDGVVIFEVPGFSAYTIKSSLPSEEETFCENGNKGDISLKILEPDEKVDITDSFNVKLKTNKEDLIAELVLEDKNNKEVLEEKEDLNEKESEFSYNSDDIDEGKYTLFVKVYEEDNEENKCTQVKKNIELKRPENKIKVKTYFHQLSCNEENLVQVDLENIGKKSEKVSINFEIPDLEISLNQDINLDKYSKKGNKEKIFFSFKTETLEKDSYESVLTINYKEKEVITKTIKAEKCIIAKLPVNSLITSQESNKIEIHQVKKQEDNTLFLVSSIILVLLVILFLLTAM